jgi:NTE family protein
VTQAKARLGIVLTGGGARAAYQVGVVRALSRFPVECVAVSGVGAGALNGLVLASERELGPAADQMLALWRQVILSPRSALQLGPVPVAGLGLYLSMLFAAGAAPSVDETLRRGGGGGVRVARHGRAQRGKPRGDVDDLLDLLDVVLELLNVSTDAELDSVLSQGFAEAAGRIDLPFFVAAHRSGDGFLDHLKLALTGTGVLAPGAPTYFAVHELPPEARVAAVLASATLPFACNPHEMGGDQYIDGSYGGMTHGPGAVPIRPLIDDPSIDALIVVHTETGAAWDAADHRGPPVLEIRPSLGKAESGVGFFWATEKDLLNWIHLGETDASARLARFLGEASGWSRAERAAEALRIEIDRLDE